LKYLGPLSGCCSNPATEVRRTPPKEEP
jgi:hypothetical protein